MNHDDLIDARNHDLYTHIIFIAASRNSKCNRNYDVHITKTDGSRFRLNNFTIFQSEFLIYSVQFRPLLYWNITKLINRNKYILLSEYSGNFGMDSKNNIWLYLVSLREFFDLTHGLPMMTTARMDRAQKGHQLKTCPCECTYTNTLGMDWHCNTTLLCVLVFIYI